ncbi:hypothetical protein [Thermococcus gorgonarius]|uniref:hypothetical protein n=1 Tax=Thermococcus gorgonarius TaxID=71997 RepID=UPI0018E00369|nr:hypothetical protein [Thermococcus gorgonarius]
MHWVLLLVNSVVLVVIIIYYINTSKYAVSLLGLMYGLLFYLTNLYFIIPYEQVENIFPSNIIEFMLSTGKITHDALATYSLSYLSYPISFILETSIILVGGIGKISIYTVGLFVFMSALYVGLIYYYSKLGRDIKFAVISLMTYMMLSFYVINDQVAPQTLALVFLPYLYKVTFDFIDHGQNLKKFLILAMFWFALVFTHPFMFLFYILPVGGIVLYNHYSPHKKNLRTSTIGLLVSIWGLGFTWLFYNLLSIPLKALIERWGEVEGETWWIFGRFLRKSGAFGPIKYTPHPHYELVPKWIVELQAWILRIILISLLLIATYGFIVYLKRSIEKGQLPYQLIFDISILVSSGALFVVGLVTNFLGQRVFQVVFMPFSRYVLSSKSNRWISIITVLILIIAPVMYTYNQLTNLTVGPQLFVQDEQLLVAGYFGNEKLPGYSKVVVARELYPSEYPTNIRKFSFPGGVLQYPRLHWNYLYYGTKFKHASEYYGLQPYSNIALIKVKYTQVYTSSTVGVILP